MKALTVRQPFADKIANRMKYIEVRSRRTEYRGDILIVSGKKPHEGVLVWESEGMLNETSAKEYAAKYCCDYGCIIAVVELHDCTPFLPEHAAQAMIPYVEGQWAWHLRNARQTKPCPIKGRLGIFDVDINLERWIL